MFKTIYFDKKPLYITDETDEFINEEKSKPGAFYINSLQENTVETAINKMQNAEVNAVIIFHPFINDVLDAFKEKVLFIQAAGGFVKNGEDILLIFRRGKWDLPKGKLDEDENLPEAAVREVEEETGIKNIEIKELLTTTYHTYYLDQEFILKETHWYLMETTDENNLTPQTEEDITECKWVNRGNLKLYLENTHPSIVDVLKEGLQKWK